MIDDDKRFLYQIKMSDTELQITIKTKEAQVSPSLKSTSDASLLTSHIQ
ncbi:MAG: hypothetical protein RLZZ455_247 [Candidatus Parcubacteria bacterium]|jgi:hypothetical protein